MKKSVLGIVLMSSFLTCSVGVSGEKLSSSQDVCRLHSRRVKKLFDALDLKRKGLEAVRVAVEKKDFPTACDALVAYYRNGKTADWLRAPAPKAGKKTYKQAEPLLKDIFTIQGVTARQPRKKSGGLDWGHHGPNKDLEWSWLLNRHSHFRNLLRGWLRTGNSRYARCFDAQIRDWVTSMSYPARKTQGAQWRGLEVGLRMRGAWQKTFYGFQGADEFTTAGRILMLSSIPDHADCLLRFHAGSSNWLLMQMQGLAMAAASWPEFRDAQKWFNYASKKMTPQIGQQVYPDGAQKELTSHYHNVCIKNFEPFMMLSQRMGRKVPASYRKGLEKMWNYLAMTMRPSGYGLLNNDSDLNDNGPQLLKAADRYSRDDWSYIASNGKNGKKPAGLASRVFPWAGHVISRSGWDSDAHWSFFDVGPAGTAHRHKDRLHLSVSAYGRDLLVDSGRYWYKPGLWRRYFRESFSHNLIIIDGCGQKTGPGSVRKAMAGNYQLNQDYDYARGTFNEGYEKLEGKVAHTRMVVYVRGRFWVVFDRVSGDRPRQLQALWHFHPDCKVESDDLQAVSVDPGKGNLRIVPVGQVPWKLELVKGREKPDIQGWYSSRYNQKQASSTAVYSARAGKESIFAWVLIPAKGKVSKVKVEILNSSGTTMTLGITENGLKTVEVGARMAGKKLLQLSKLRPIDADCAVFGHLNR
jgi:Heparinase II/III N-terminus/Heparinase II/III-like protein